MAPSCGLRLLWPLGLSRRNMAVEEAAGGVAVVADMAEAALAAVVQAAQVPAALGARAAEVVTVVPAALEAQAPVEAADTEVPVVPEARVAQVPAVWEHHLCITSRDKSFRSFLSRQRPTSRCSTNSRMEPAASSSSTPTTYSAAWRRSPRTNRNTIFSATNRLNRRKEIATRCASKSTAAGRMSVQKAAIATCVPRICWQEILSRRILRVMLPASWRETSRPPCELRSSTLLQTQRGSTLWWRFPPTP